MECGMCGCHPSTQDNLSGRCFQRTENYNTNLNYRIFQIPTITLLNPPYDRRCATALADTYYTLHSEKNYCVHRDDIYRIHDNGTGPCPRHRKGCILDRCTGRNKREAEDYELNNWGFDQKKRCVTFPKRTPQFSQSACTFWRVSHCVQMSSVRVFRSKWCSSFSSWQYRHL